MLKRLTINRIDPVSAGKVFGIISVVMGILFSLLSGAWLLIEYSVRLSSGPGTGLEVIFAMMVLLIAPFGMGMFGFVLGLLMAMFHNTAVGYLGGLVLEADDDSEEDD